jgi:hypothetical protein
MYKFSGYPEASLSFAEYIRANHAPNYQVNNCIVFNSLAIFLQVAREEGLKPEKFSKIQDLKKIAYLSKIGESLTA